MSLKTEGEFIEPGPDAVGPIRVVVADDHPMIRAGLFRILQAHGIQVVGEASTGREAVERVRSLDPDIVMMDVQMPDMDGLAATEVIKHEAPRTSVIIVSGHQSKDDLVRALAVGACGYLPKVITQEALIDAVRLVRNGGSFVDNKLLREVLREIRTGSEATTNDCQPAESLSPREREVLCMLAEGLTNKEIGQQLHYSVGYIKNIVQRIIEKLGVSDRTQAAVYAVRSGVTSS